MTLDDIIDAQSVLAHVKAQNKKQLLQELSQSLATQVAIDHRVIFETLLKRAGEIKQPKRRENLQNNADLARISKRLVTLRDDVPPPETLAQMKWESPDREKLLNFLQTQEFRQLVSRAAAWLDGNTVPIKRAFGGTAEAPAAAPAPNGWPAWREPMCALPRFWE